MLIADLEFIADDIVSQAVVIEVVLGDVFDSSFLFGHSSMIFCSLYAKIVPKTQVVVARVHTCADVACVAISVCVWGTRVCNL